VVSRAEGFFDEGFCFVGEGQLQGGLVAAGGHFFPGFADDVDEFGFVVLERKIGEIVVQEHQADDVFEQLRFWIELEALFADQGLYAGDGGLVVADALEDFAEFVGVHTLAGGAPAMIAGAIHGEGITGDGPAADVLAMSGQAEWFGSVGLEAVQPVGHSLRVNEFFGLLDALKCFTVGVGRVGGVDAGDGSDETVGCCHFESTANSPD
jgi:hypothetical protein